MKITPGQASDTALILAEAANRMPVTAIQYEMRRRAKEWAEAADLAMEAAEHGSEVGIEIFGAVLPGMYVYRGSDGFDGGEPPFKYVIRQLRQGGQVSLHLDHHRNPAGTYVNFHGEASPVVVKL